MGSWNVNIYVHFSLRKTTSNLGSLCVNAFAKPTETGDSIAEAFGV